MSKKIAISSARQLQHGQPSCYQDRGIQCTPYMLSMGSSICRATRMPELATSACDRRHAYSSGQSETRLWHEVAEDATAAASATNEKSTPRAHTPSVVQPVVLPPVLPPTLGKSRISRNSGVPGFPGCQSGGWETGGPKEPPGQSPAGAGAGAQPPGLVDGSRRENERKPKNPRDGRISARIPPFDAPFAPARSPARVWLKSGFGSARRRAKVVLGKRGQGSPPAALKTILSAGSRFSSPKRSGDEFRPDWSPPADSAGRSSGRPERRPLARTETPLRESRNTGQGLRKCSTRGSWSQNNRRPTQGAGKTQHNDCGNTVSGSRPVGKRLVTGW